MTSLLTLLFRELITSALFGGFLYLYTQEQDYIRCMCFIPISIFALSRLILQMIGSLGSDIYCGLTESWMLPLMNIPCFLIMIYLFPADFVIGFRDTVSQAVLVGLKSYMFLIYMMYIRFYLGLFNLELQFSFLPIILEAAMSGFIWDYSSSETLQRKILFIAVCAFMFQVIIYVIIFSKQTKQIIPRISMPFGSTIREIKNETEASKDVHSSNKKKVNKKKKN